jgi:hypothetical protein
MSARDVGMVTSRQRGSPPWNMRWSLEVYSKPHDSLSLEIIDASWSSEADLSWTRRFASILE